MKTYRRNFKKIVYGFGEVSANNIKEAYELFELGEDVDEFDNNSEYEWEDEVRSEEPDRKVEE